MSSPSSTPKKAKGKFRFLKKTPSLKSEEARVSIINAVIKGDIQVLTQVLANGKQFVNEKDPEGWTPLHFAAHTGNYDMMELLLAAQANPNLPTNDGTLPLHYLVRQPSSPRMLHLLREVIMSMQDIDFPNRFGETALFSAILRANIEAIDILLQEGADANKPQRDGETPLHYAVRRGIPQAVQKLLEYDADPNILSKHNTSAYDLAVRTKATKVLVLFARFNVLKQGEDTVGQAVEAARDAEDRALIDELKTEVIREWRRSKFRSRTSNPTPTQAKLSNSSNLPPIWQSPASSSTSPVQDRLSSSNDEPSDSESASFDSLEGGSEEEFEFDEGPLTAAKVWEDVSSEDTKAHIERVGTISLGELLGRGAYGRVFKGLDLTTGQFVAVKEFIWMKLFHGFETVAMIEQQLSCLLQEIEMLKELDHPNIVRYLRWHKTSFGLYLVMEYVEGGSLAQILRLFGPSPEHLVALYAQQILDGISYLHKRCIGHRDLKGANILITKDGICKIGDFGLAIQVAAAGEQAGSAFVGTPYWMPPEVVENESGTVSLLSDIWSFGCVILEMLFGHHPYSNLEPLQAIFCILEESHPPFPPDISDNLLDFLNCCFHRKETMRSTAEELLRHRFITTAQKEARPRLASFEDLRLMFQRNRSLNPESELLHLPTSSDIQKNFPLPYFESYSLDGSHSSSLESLPESNIPSLYLRLRELALNLADSVDRLSTRSGQTEKAIHHLLKKISETRSENLTPSRRHRTVSQLGSSPSPLVSQNSLGSIPSPSRSSKAPRASSIMSPEAMRDQRRNSSTSLAETSDEFPNHISLVPLIFDRQYIFCAPYRSRFSAKLASSYSNPLSLGVPRWTIHLWAVCCNFLLAFPSSSESVDAPSQPIAAIYIPFASESDNNEKKSDNVFVLSLEDPSGCLMLRCNSCAQLKELRDAFNEAHDYPWYYCEEVLSSYAPLRSNCNGEIDNLTNDSVPGDSLSSSFDESVSKEFISRIKGTGATGFLNFVSKNN